MSGAKYAWHNLLQQGDWLVVEDVTPIQIRTTVNAYVKRHFGQDAVVMTRQIPGGTFVVLAYVPPEVSEVVTGSLKLSGVVQGSPKVSGAVANESDAVDFDADPDEDIKDLLDD